MYVLFFTLLTYLPALQAYHSYCYLVSSQCSITATQLCIFASYFSYYIACRLHLRNMRLRVFLSCNSNFFHWPVILVLDIYMTYHVCWWHSSDEGLCHHSWRGQLVLALVRGVLVGASSLLLFPSRESRQSLSYPWVSLLSLSLYLSTEMWDLTSSYHLYYFACVLTLQNSEWVTRLKHLAYVPLSCVSTSICWPYVSLWCRSASDRATEKACYIRKDLTLRNKTKSQSFYVILPAMRHTIPRRTIQDWLLQSCCLLRSITIPLFDLILE